MLVMMTHKHVYTLNNLFITFNIDLSFFLSFFWISVIACGILELYCFFLHLCCFVVLFFGVFMFSIKWKYVVCVGRLCQFSRVWQYGNENKTSQENTKKYLNRKE